MIGERVKAKTRSRIWVKAKAHHRDASLAHRKEVEVGTTNSGKMMSDQPKIFDKARAKEDKGHDKEDTSSIMEHARRWDAFAALGRKGTRHAACCARTMGQHTIQINAENVALASQQEPRGSLEMTVGAMVIRRNMTNGPKTRKLIGKVPMAKATKDRHGHKDGQADPGRNDKEKDSGASVGAHLEGKNESSRSLQGRMDQGRVYYTS